MNDLINKQVEKIVKIEIAFDELDKKVKIANENKIRAVQEEANAMNEHERMKKEKELAYDKLREIILRNNK